MHKYASSPGNQNKMPSKSSNELETLKQTIEDLQVIHEQHISKLNSLHKSELEIFSDENKKLRKKTTELTTEKDKLEEIVGTMKLEIEMVRQSFDLVQERLKRVLVDQDDLVRLVKLLDQSQIRSKYSDSSRPGNNNGHVHVQKNRTHSPCAIKELETNLKEEAPSQANVAVLQAIKYFKKLEASDPVHLCRLLDISFCPDRSFSLANSLLTSISVHLSEDNSALKSFNQFPLYPILLNEIVKLKKEINDLSGSFLNFHFQSTNKSRPHKNKNFSMETICKKIEDKNERGNISMWLIEEFDAKKDDNEEFKVTNSTLLTSFLSKFKL